MSVLGLCFRINDSGVFAWISLTASSWTLLMNNDADVRNLIGNYFPLICMLKMSSLDDMSIYMSTQPNHHISSFFVILFTIYISI